MSKRVNVTLPNKVYEQLEQVAKEQGRPIANLASYLVQKSMETITQIKK